MNAIRAARAYTGKKKIIAFEGAYHGSSDSVTVPGLAVTSAGILPEVEKNTIMVPFNDIHALEKTVRDNQGEVAAIILEPILAAGGAVVPDLDFGKGVGEIAARSGCLFILDEIVTGFRISRGGWQQKYGLDPDRTTLGKNVSGGMPGAAVVGKKEVMEDVYGASPASSPKAPLSGTYNAFPLSMVAGLAALNQLNDDVYSRIDQSAATLREGFNKISSDLKVEATSCGTGSLFQFHFTKENKIDYSSAQRADKRKRWLLDIALMNRGVYLAPGHFCVTSSSTSETDVRTTLDSIAQALEEIRGVHE
jgi:glutamate-1-semialdehyde 2,1-aminomutase